MLKELLQVYDKQGDSLSHVLVVDNHSNDGTEAYLNEWASAHSSYVRTVIRLPSNTGGSGGFYRGLTALKEFRDSIDFVYIADDDAFPEEGLFKQFIHKYSNVDHDVSGICTSVISHGKYDLNHRRLVKTQGRKVIETNIPENEYDKTFELNSASFVGLFVRGSAIQTIDVQKDYFISYDDTDYCLSLCRHGKIICDPKLRVHHNVNLDEFDVSWKRYYSIRNQLITYRRQFSTSIALYAFAKHIFGATLILLGLREANKPHRFTRCMIMFTAWKDAALLNQGMHSRYKPGWKIHKPTNSSSLNNVI
jgi:GT2 family glycosyltransferase